jgi:DtxR family Mn-dependent transcriptional regulator
MHSDKLEDYLKAIYVLEAHEGVAKTGALAQHLGITPGSVTEMIKRIADVSPRLIHYRQHHGVTLTAKGRKEAMSVIRRHRLLETFLHQTLGFGWEDVHAEAEILEHHLSDRMVRAIDRHLSYPKFDPHGEPIPDGNGNLAFLEGEKLSSIAPGTRIRILRVDPSISGMLQYLDEMGIGLGTTGIVENIAPFGGPVTLRIDGAGADHTRSIGSAVADRIYAVTQIL